MILRRYIKIRSLKVLHVAVGLLTLSFIYILYQLYGVEQMSYFRNDEFHEPLTRGVHIMDKYKYLPDMNGMFTCLRKYQTIKHEFVNDDYCDCEDGTDEPGTNACPDGVFYCTTLAYSRVQPIPSNRVNDGICDCCDGSDEWNSIPLTATINNFHTHIKVTEPQHFCKNICK